MNNEMNMTSMKNVSDSCWLNAWYDPLSNLHTSSHALCLGGDVFYVGDLSGILHVISAEGKVIKRIKLAGPATAVCRYWGEGGTELIAVACYSTVYIFRKLEPFFKFNVPGESMSTKEYQIWKNVSESNVDVSYICNELRNEPNLSQRSMNLLALQADPQRAREYVLSEISNGCFDPLEAQVTCMAVLFRKSDSLTGGVGSLVLGTESKKILILDAATKAIDTEVILPSVPVYLCIMGSIGEGYRIFTACRNSRIYFIKDGLLTDTRVCAPASFCGGLIAVGYTVVAATTDNRLQSYDTTGAKIWNILLPDRVTNLVAFHAEQHGMEGTIVSLRNRELRLYIGKALIDKTDLGNRSLMALQFGSFNREANSLISLDTNGGLAIQILRRKVALHPTDIAPKNASSDEEIPLAVPKKTKLFVQQMDREKAESKTMHAQFQYDLCKLRVSAAKAYLKLYENSGSANAQLKTSANHYLTSNQSDARLQVDANVSGLGPKFKVVVDVENTGTIPLYGVYAIVSSKKGEYVIDKPLLRLPLLAPQTPSTVTFAVDAEVNQTESSQIQIYFKKDDEILILASIEMPSVESFD